MAPKVGDTKVGQCEDWTHKYRFGPEDVEVTYGPDPYKSDIDNDDSSPLWQCIDCWRQSAEDI